jgi:YjbR
MILSNQRLVSRKLPETKNHTRTKSSMEKIRGIALLLPGAVELDHHGRPSFRINEKIFATIWDENHVNVMLDPVRITEVARKNPKTCAEFWWGRQLRCISVDVRSASAKLLAQLLGEAYQRKTKKIRATKRS